MADVLLALAVEALVGASVTGAGVLLVARAPQVAGSWADGAAWLTARRADAAAAARMLAAVLAAVVVRSALWLLALAVRPTGKHRAEVA